MCGDEVGRDVWGHVAGGWQARLGRQDVEGGAGTQQICLIQTPFLGSLWQSGAAQTCAAKISCADLSRTVGAAAVLPMVREKNIPLPWIAQQQPQSCAGYSIGMQTCLFNHKIGFLARSVFGKVCLCCQGNVYTSKF